MAQQHPCEVQPFYTVRNNPALTVRRALIPSPIHDAGCASCRGFTEVFILGADYGDVLTG
jgi:hypothetical protein